MAWCKACNIKLTEGSRYCPRCGRMLRQREVMGTSPRLRRWLGTTGSLLVVGFIALNQLLPRLLTGIREGERAALWLAAALGVVLLFVLLHRMQSESGGRIVSGPAPEQSSAGSLTSRWKAALTTMAKEVESEQQRQQAAARTKSESGSEETPGQSGKGNSTPP